MSKLWHIGLAVPDLERAMAEVGALFDLAWRPVLTHSLTVKDGEGRAFDIDLPVTFSVGGPFAIEVFHAVPGTPLATPASGWLHHVGYWVDDYPAERERLARLGYPTVASSGPNQHVARGPGNLQVEPCSLHFDMPHLRDLYPPDSPFFGDPADVPNV